MISTLVEAVLRSLLLALAVGLGLRAFRVRNVLAQKAAWGLVLVMALFMPLLVPMAARWQILPANATVLLPVHSFAFLTTQQPQAQIAVPLAPPSREAVTVSQEVPKGSPALLAWGADRQDPVPPNTVSSPIALNVRNDAVTKVEPTAVPARRSLSRATLAWLLYLAVATAFVSRLLYGLVVALRLWNSAEPAVINDTPSFAAGLDLRSSCSVSSPVTIASSVVLPADYPDWDSEKLRIVLAHERSHIQQGDFYLQLLAGLYSAVFWFSPLGWWLKRTLSDLGEAISDRAGLEQAGSRSSYAQILLEFAAAPRPTHLGVAMARTGSLTRRIERLLNDSAFRQAFAGGRSRVLAAVLLVPAGLFTATALIRVQATGQEPQQAEPAVQPAPPAEPASVPQTAMAPTAARQAAPTATGVSDPEPAPAPEADQDMPSPPIVLVAPTPPNVVLVGPRVLNLSPLAVVAPNPPNAVLVAPRVLKLPPPAVVAPLRPMSMVVRVPSLDGRAYVLAHAGQDAAFARGYSYHDSLNGDSYAVITGDEREHMSFSGDIHTDQIDKARKLAHGNFLWFTHNGKSYFVDDPSVVARIQAMYAPMEALGKQQEELGRQQEELGKKQEDLGHQQEQASIPTPDISKEMAELNASMAKLQAKMGKTITREELADLQGQLGELQGRLGALQGEMGSRQGEFGGRMGQLGAEQGELEAKQGKLGAEQGRLAMEADQKVKGIIDQSLQNGKAHPVD
jgi:beta-lactamase regulating signal transducer with metallopeptidase domain